MSDKESKCKEWLSEVVSARIYLAQKCIATLYSYSSLSQVRILLKTSIVTAFGHRDLACENA